MFTKKHFEAVAEVIRDVRAKHTVPNSVETMQSTAEIAKRFASMFATSNPRFSRSSFLEACGVDPS